MYEQPGADQSNYGERQDHEKDPAPVIHLTEIAARHWPEDWPHNHTHTEYSGGGAMLRFRIGLQHDGLRDGHQRSPKTALHDAKRDQGLQ